MTVSARLLGAVLCVKNAYADQLNCHYVQQILLCKTPTNTCAGSFYGSRDCIPSSYTLPAGLSILTNTAQPIVLAETNGTIYASVTNNTLGCIWSTSPTLLSPNAFVQGYCQVQAKRYLPPHPPRARRHSTSSPPALIGRLDYTEGGVHEMLARRSLSRHVDLPR